MALRAGIVGLPNVGKSTLFNAITSSSVLAENYPFATIEPTTGTVAVPDERIAILSNIFKSKKIIPTTFEFTDIAGLVKGASRGEGLGNQFLAAIREVDAICHVVRCFAEQSIVHVEGSVDPLRDIDIINTELMFADLESVEKRIQKVEKKAQSTKDNEVIFEYQTLSKARNYLNQGIVLRLGDFETAEKEFLQSQLHLLTLKPVIYVANVDEDELITPEQNQYFTSLKEFSLKENSGIVAISAKMEEDISRLDDKKEFLDSLGLKQSGLEKLITIAYNTLGLKTFFTCGEPETHAWTFKSGDKAPVCAGYIHSDFEKGFIRAEVYNFQDINLYKSETAVKENGKWRLEGKDYQMRDGDICHFRFALSKQ